MFCQIYKLVISWRLDHHRPLPSRVRKHIQSCQTCTAYLHTCAQLEKHGKTNTTCPSYLQDRILTAVGQSHNHHGNASPAIIPLRRRNLPALLAASIFIALAALWLLWEHGPRKIDSRDTIPTDSLTKPFLAGVDPDAWNDWNGMMETTLGDELDCLYRDTEETVNYLVACLPQDWANGNNTNTVEGTY
ncbi:MAG: hypothetical protein JW709_08540 [Sedimentisphaerales bacterium]|nr:hypothetical protein [Sedimentisphaerales bacterium]